MNGETTTQIRFFHGSHVGRKRQFNEDAYALATRPCYCIVADGMGGHRSGEVASRMAVEIMAHSLKNKLPRRLHEGPRRPGDRYSQMLQDLLETWTQDANRAIYDRGTQERKASDRDGKQKRMGTTMAMLYLGSHYAMSAHVGDSRIYLVRQGVIESVTRDHAINTDDIPPEQRPKGKNKKKYLTRTLGTRPKARPDVRLMDLRDGDVFLLCTDGLSDLVTDEELCRYISGKVSQDTVQQLIHLANQRGGKDNITVVLAAIGGDEEETSPLTSEVG